MRQTRVSELIGSPVSPTGLDMDMPSPFPTAAEFEEEIERRSVNQSHEDSGEWPHSPEDYSTRFSFGALYGASGNEMQQTPPLQQQRYQSYRRADS